MLMRLLFSIGIALALTMSPIAVTAQETAWTGFDQTFADRFRIIVVGSIEEERLEELGQTFFAGFPAVLALLGNPELPLVTIKVYGDRALFEEAYGDENAQMVGGFIWSDRWETHSYNWSGRAGAERPLGTGVLHEYTHLVSLAVNPTISHNPRWLWETVAVYASKRPTPPSPQALKCVSTTSIPSLDALESHPGNVYRLGFYLGEYIVERWGGDALRALVASNADLEGTLGVDRRDFEAGWLSFMAATYELRPGSAAIEANC